MRDLLIVVGFLADSIVFWWLLVAAYPRLVDGSNIYEGCALVVTAVMWQRHGKEGMLREMRLRNTNKKDNPHE